MVTVGFGFFMYVYNEGSGSMSDITLGTNRVIAQDVTVRVNGGK